MTASPSPVTQATTPHPVPRQVHLSRPACRPVDPMRSPADPQVDRPDETDDVVSDWRWGMSGFG